jgi:hypothetical protein
MSFKTMKTNLTFADISLFNYMEKNRAIKRMELINVTVDWSRIESLLKRCLRIKGILENRTGSSYLLIRLKTAS